jgi:hypothetical protein
VIKYKSNNEAEAAIMTAEEILEEINKLPNREKVRLLARLSRTRGNSLNEAEESGIEDDLLALAGCMDTKKVLIVNPSREWMYEERLDDLLGF